MVLDLNQPLGARRNLGISRVAVKKRVAKLEQEGIIRGYKAVVYREDRVKMLLEITK